MKKSSLLNKLKSFKEKIKQYFCDPHVTLTSEIKRRPDGKVEFYCLKCGKHLVADCGLNLPGRLISKRDQL